MIFEESPDNGQAQEDGHHLHVEDRELLTSKRRRLDAVHATEKHQSKRGHREWFNVTNVFQFVFRPFEKLLCMVKLVSETVQKKSPRFQSLGV